MHSCIRRDPLFASALSMDVQVQLRCVCSVGKKGNKRSLNDIPAYSFKSNSRAVRSSEHVTK